MVKKSKRIPFSLKIDPDTLAELRRASSYRRGWMYNDSISSITERAIQQYLLVLKDEMNEELKRHGGEFPERVEY